MWGDDRRIIRWRNHETQIPVPTCEDGVRNWLADYAQSMGAALAYYTVFSIAALLVIVIAVAAMIFGQDAAQAAIIEQASSMIGDNGAKAIEGMLAGAQRMKHGVIANTLEILVPCAGSTSSRNWRPT